MMKMYIPSSHSFYYKHVKTLQQMAVTRVFDRMLISGGSLKIAFEHARGVDLGERELFVDKAKLYIKTNAYIQRAASRMTQ
jgi:hypothetical protein